MGHCSHFINFKVHMKKDRDGNCSLDSKDDTNTIDFHVSFRFIILTALVLNILLAKKLFDRSKHSFIHNSND